MDVTTFLLGMLVGIALCAVLSAVLYSYIKGKKLSPAASKYIPALVAVLLTLAFALPRAAFAQTPVPLEIPTNVIFTETNNWLQTFAPIAAIGIGITLALAVLGYIGKLIISAFR